MAISRIPLYGLSLWVAIFSWAPSSLAGPADRTNDPCAEAMAQMYHTIRDAYRLRLESKEGPGNYDRTLVEKYVPPFKQKCGTKEANSVRDLENSVYFTRVVAEYMREKKAQADVQYQSGTAGQDDDLEDLEIQR